MGLGKRVVMRREGRRSICWNLGCLEFGRGVTVSRVILRMGCFWFKIEMGALLFGGLFDDVW